MGRFWRTADGRPRVGMTAHTWGWPPTRGGGHSHLGMAGLHLGMAAHTWGWRVYTWGRPLTPGDGGRGFPCGDSHFRQTPVLSQPPSEVAVGPPSNRRRRRGVALAPPSAGTSMPMRFAPPRPCETRVRHRGTALIGGRDRARASERSGPCPLLPPVGRSLLSFCLLFRSQF